MNNTQNQSDTIIDNLLHNRILKLEQLCVPGGRKSKTLYWRSEMYGMGQEFRKFGFYPKNWPLNIYSAHGVYMGDQPSQHELDTRAPVMMYFTKKVVEVYRHISSKRCYCVIAPFAFHRRRKNITQSRDAIGTIVFVGHSTALIDDLINVETYIDQLEELPKKYKPLTICLHSNDIEKGLHKTFVHKGFEVVTAGYPMRADYTKRFYDLLKRHKYASSNAIGSYTFYATEMGIPFFLYGEASVLYNKRDKNMETGLYTSYTTQSNFVKAAELFKSQSEEVSIAQKEFVEELMGIHDSISRMKMAMILYYTYFLYWKTKDNKLLPIKKRIKKIANKFGMLK